MPSNVSTMTPSQPIMTLVSEKYSQTKITPEIIDHRFVYMCKVVFTGNQSLIESRYFNSFARSVEFAKTRIFPDNNVRISVHIYGIPFEEPSNFLDKYYINSLHN
jgi:hypothetical protein